MSKLVILIWDMGLGGVQRQTADIITHISHHFRDVEVELWVKNSGKNYYPGLTALPQVTVIEFFGSKNKKQTLIDEFRFLRQSLSSRPDVVLTFHDYLSILSAFNVLVLRLVKSVKFVIYEPNLTSLFMSSRNRSFIWKWLIRVFYPVADTVITTTEVSASDLCDQFKLKRKSIMVIPTWCIFPQKRNLTIRNIDLLFLGRLEPQKQPELFVELVDSLIKIHKYSINSVIAGNGELGYQLKKLIKKLNLNERIKMAGAIFPQDVPVLLANTKVLALTSLYEGMPLTILEAGANGVPIVALRYLGVEEVIDHGRNGFIADSQVEMIDYIYMLLSNETMRQKLAVLSIKHVIDQFGRKNVEMFVNQLIPYHG